MWGYKRPITGTGRETYGHSLALVVLVNIILIHNINLYLEPGIEATACARELLRP